MANDVVYFSTREPMVNAKGEITLPWARYFNTTGRRIQIIDGTFTVSTALPATPDGYMVINVSGQKRRVPYYI